MPLSSSRRSSSFLVLMCTESVRLGQLQHRRSLLAPLQYTWQREGTHDTEKHRDDAELRRCGLQVHGRSSASPVSHQGTGPGGSCTPGPGGRSDHCASPPSSHRQSVQRRAQLPPNPGHGHRTGLAGEHCACDALTRRPSPYRPAADHGHAAGEQSASALGTVSVGTPRTAAALADSGHVHRKWSGSDITFMICGCSAPLGGRRRPRCGHRAPHHGFAIPQDMLM